MRKYWVIAGVLLLVAGVFLALFPAVETFKQMSVATSIEVGGDHFLEPFSAGSQDWLDFDLLATGDVNIFVRGQIYRTVFNLKGRLFQYKVYFEDYDAYQVEIYNPDYADNAVNVTGGIYLRRTPRYLYPLDIVGLVRVNGIGIPVILLGVGIAIIGLVKKLPEEAK